MSVQTNKQLSDMKEDLYFVWASSPLGGGYLHLEGNKRIWGDFSDKQLFTKEEVDEILPKISRPFDWKCYDLKHNLYKEK
jgi:hypothetical protein